jgi:cysteine-rich repeat protein
MRRRFEIGAGIVVVMLALAGPARAQCLGDCNGSGDVVVNELITGVNIALGTAQLTACPSFDKTGDGQVAVSELVTAVINALTGCPAAAVCGNGKKEGDEECDDGNTWNGDGCADNCTEEQSLRCTMTAGAEVVLQTNFVALHIPVSGEMGLKAGKARGTSGEIPTAIKATDMQFAPVAIEGMLCACVQGGGMTEFGPGNAANGHLGCGNEGLTQADYLTSVDHYTNDADPNCTNGVLEDGSSAHPHTGLCNGKPVLTPTSGGPRGSLYLDAMLAVGLVYDGGACTYNCAIEDNGPDCTPCTSDDTGQVLMEYVHLTTGTATGEVMDADTYTVGNPSGTKIPENVDDCGGMPCITSVTGSVVNCAALATDPNAVMSGAVLGGALPNLDTEGVGDNVVTFMFGCE